MIGIERYKNIKPVPTTVRPIEKNNRKGLDFDNYLEVAKMKLQVNPNGTGKIRPK